MGALTGLTGCGENHLPPWPTPEELDADITWGCTRETHTFFGGTAYDAGVIGVASNTSWFSPCPNSALNCAIMESLLRQCAACNVGACNCVSAVVAQCGISTGCYSEAGARTTNTLAGLTAARQRFVAEAATNNFTCRFESSP